MDFGNLFLIFKYCEW